VVPSVADNDIAEDGPRERFCKCPKHVEVSVIRQNHKMLDLSSIHESPFNVHEVVADADSDTPIAFAVKNVDCRIWFKRPRRCQLP
jgi:hypothetical protein